MGCLCTLVDSTDPSTNNGPLAVPYLKGRRKLILWIVVVGAIKSGEGGGQGRTKVSIQNGTTLSPKMGPEGHMEVLLPFRARK